MAGFLIGIALFLARCRKYTEKEVENGEYDLELLDNYKQKIDPVLKKKQRNIKIVKRVFYSVFLVVVFALLVLSILSKTGFGKYSIIVVASGSMSQKNPINDYLVDENLDDQFPTNCIIVIEKVDTNDLKKYDTIVYTNDHDMNIIHRIVRIEETASEKRFVTKGDANTLEDDYHPYPEDVQGKYTGFYIAGIGAFILFLKSSIGIATMVALLIGLFIVDRSRNKISDIRYNRLEFILEKLAINQDNILSFDNDTLSKMIEDANLRQHTEEMDGESDNNNSLFFNKSNSNDADNSLDKNEENNLVQTDIGNSENENDEDAGTNNE